MLLLEYVYGREIGTSDEIQMRHILLFLTAKTKESSSC